MGGRDAADHAAGSPGASLLWRAVQARKAHWSWLAGTSAQVAQRGEERQAGDAPHVGAGLDAVVQEFRQQTWAPSRRGRALRPSRRRARSPAGACAAGSGWPRPKGGRESSPVDSRGTAGCAHWRSISSRAVGLQGAQALAHRDLLGRDPAVDEGRQDRRRRGAGGLAAAAPAAGDDLALLLLEGRQPRALLAHERMGVGIAREQVVQLLARSPDPLREVAGGGASGGRPVRRPRPPRCPAGISCECGRDLLLHLRQLAVQVVAGLAASWRCRFWV
jgi:hypothetical protein